MSYPDRYKVLRRERARRDLRSAVLYLVVALVALAIACWVSAMPVFGQSNEPAIWGDAYCFVCTSTGPGTYDRGTGTLVDETHVLTCWHTFRDSPGTYWVQFGSGPQLAAKLVASDPDGELALLEVPRGAGRPVQLDLDSLSPPLQFGGFGTNAAGSWRWITGSTMKPESHWLTFYGETACERGVCQQVAANANLDRSGDSGGPVLNSAHKLVGVQWGATGRQIYFCHPHRLGMFLRRHLPHLFRRPTVYVTQPSVYQQPQQQPVQQPGIDDPWQSSGNPSQGGGTYAGGEAGPQPSAVSDQQEAKAPETSSQPSAVSSQPVFDTEWANQVDRNIDTLDETTKDLGERVDGFQQTYTGDMEKVANDIHGEEGAVATAIKTKIDAILGEINDIAAAKVDEKIKPIDTKLGEIKKSLVVTVAGHAAQLFGINLPPTLLAAGSLLGGPVGLAAAAFAYWRLKKRIDAKKQPGAGGAGSAPSFRG